MPPPSDSQAPFDVVVHGGVVVTETGRRRIDIGIRGETIAELGTALRGHREIDAHGQLVLPGGVDPHVHLTCSDMIEGEPGWVDDFESGSAAALAGGITSLGNMTFVLPGETVTSRLARESAEASRKAIADIFLHPVLLSPTPEVVNELAEVARAGVTTIKFFMSMANFEKDAGQFGLAMRAAKQSGAMTMIHCEDHATIECCTTQLTQNGNRSLADFAATRPAAAEIAATERAIAMCEATGAPTYIVHLSSERALEACANARARGLPIFVETRPTYLHLTRERYGTPDGPLFVVQPPLRENEDREALWVGLASGSIDTMGSDHAPWNRDLKMRADHHLENLRPGVSDLETMLPMLMTAGVLDGRLSLERFVALTATNAARLFGLYPRKGTIAVGSDADLAIWDLNANHVIGEGESRSRADHSIYKGFLLRACPQVTIRRGSVVFSDGIVHGAAGSGHVLSRGPSQAIPHETRPKVGTPK